MRSTTGSLLRVGLAAAAVFITTGFLSSGVRAQTSPELRDVQNQFIPEEGCPVRIVKAETRMEVDSFGAPLACRIYIDYTNSSSKPINGVKFKIGYVDSKGTVRGHFHAPDGKELSPGAQSSPRWRGEKVDPRTKLVKIRVLMARYSDGVIWQSEKAKGVIKPGSEEEDDDQFEQTGSSTAPLSGMPSGGAASGSSGDAVPNGTPGGPPTDRSDGL